MRDLVSVHVITLSVCVTESGFQHFYVGRLFYLITVAGHLHSARLNYKAPIPTLYIAEFFIYLWVTCSLPIMRIPVRFLVRQFSSSQSCVLFSVLGDRITSRRLLPLRSPYLKPYGYCLWGILKVKVFSDHPRIEDGMKWSKQDVWSSQFHYHNLEVQWTYFYKVWCICASRRKPFPAHL